MTILSVSLVATFVEPDTTQTVWKDISFTGLHTFPSSKRFLVGDTEWLVECYIIPGRFGDKLVTHVLRSTDDGLFDPIIDYVLQTGVEIVIDNQMRLYGIDIQPDLRDNYETTEVHGVYQIGVAEVTV